MHGGHLNRETMFGRRTPSTSLPALLDQLRAQRHRIASLSRETGTLQSRGKSLLKESYLVAARVEQSRARLANAFLTTRSALAELRLSRAQNQGGIPIAKSHGLAAERVLADPPDLLEALQQATEILKMEFSDTEGSGRETLVKCEKALRRNCSRIIELRLY
jgi:hypothetical protein